MGDLLECSLHKIEGEISGCAYASNSSLFSREDDSDKSGAPQVGHGIMGEASGYMLDV
jgi:hypothetical protein